MDSKPSSKIILIVSIIVFLIIISIVVFILFWYFFIRDKNSNSSLTDNDSFSELKKSLVGKEFLFELSFLTENHLDSQSSDELVSANVSGTIGKNSFKSSDGKYVLHISENGVLFILEKKEGESLSSKKWLIKDILLEIENDAYNNPFYVSIDETNDNARVFVGTASDKKIYRSTPVNSLSPYNHYRLYFKDSGELTIQMYETTFGTSPFEEFFITGF